MPKYTRRLNRGKKKFRISRSSKRKSKERRKTRKNRKSRRLRQAGGSGMGSLSFSVGTGKCDKSDKKCQVQKELKELFEEAYNAGMLVEGGYMTPANAAILADETSDQRMSRIKDETPPQKKIRERIDQLEGLLQTLSFGDRPWNPCEQYDGTGTPPISYGVGAIGSRARAKRLGTGPIFGKNGPPDSEKCTHQDCTTQHRGYGSGSNPGGRCAPLLHLYTACNSGWCANVKH